MKETDIRPLEKFNKYLSMSKEDVKHFFSDSRDRKKIFCPACASEIQKLAFTKDGFTYQECLDCFSIYQSPRPSLESYKNFYTNSASSQYWANEFFPSVIEARREKIFKPRCERLRELCQAECHDPKNIADIGAGVGVFLDEIGKFFPSANLTAIEPSFDMSKTCQTKGFNVIESVLEEIPEDRFNEFDLLTCFEVIEHVYCPLDFVVSLGKILKPGGWVLVTGLCGDGFDIRSLWEYSKSVSPPHHINFLSVQGFHRLFKNSGFDEVMITTPGKLDVDIIINTKQELNLNRFEEILLRRGNECQSAFQKFLQDFKLSSHIWIWARKSSEVI